MIDRVHQKMSTCGSKSMIDLMQEKDALETGIFSPKNAALLLVGTDACPGTAVPGGTSYTDSDTTVGANNTVNSIQTGCSNETSTPGPDKIYKFVLPVLASRIPTCSISMTATGGADLAIYTLSDTGTACPAGTGNNVTNCVNGSDIAGTEVITDAEMDAMPAGTYYLFVDSFYTGGVGQPAGNGPYTVNINCTTLGPTASYVGVGGRVTTAEGRGIANAKVSVMLPGGESRFAITNPFGFYRIDDMEAGPSYVFQVSSKTHSFANPTQLINVSDSVEDLNFVADAPGSQK
jgi:hypothetical protein